MELSSSDEEITQPSKRARTNCFIHCTDDTSDSLVTLQSLDSWHTLMRAAEIRTHKPVLNLAKSVKEGEVPHLQYHRKCRSIFTMKKLLDAIIAKRAESETSETSSRKSSRDAPTTSRVYDKVCIFCEKSSKYLKGQKTRESLMQCLELRADYSIRKAATSKQDHRILAILTRELVAAEGHYHKSCYKLYTKDESSASSSTAKEVVECQNAEYEKVERGAYEELYMYIRNNFLANQEIVPMTYFTSRLENSMISLGINQIRLSTKKHVRRKLEREFDKSLHFISDEKGRVLIYPDSLSMENLVKQVYTMGKDLQDARDANSGDV